MPSPKAPSANLLAKRGAQIVMNKDAVDALYAGMADGLVELGERIIADARASAPRDPTTAAARGVPMMADTGSVSVWGPVNGKSSLLHGSAQVAAGKNKPKGLKVPVDQVVMVAAFASPLSHFAELGTIKEPARPFLTPALMSNIGNAGEYVKGAMSRRVASAPQRAMASAAIKARIAAGGG